MPQQPPRPLPGASDERFDPSNAPPRRLPFELQHGAAPIVESFRPWEERMAPVAPVATVVAQQQPPPPPQPSQQPRQPQPLQPQRARSGGGGGGSGGVLFALPGGGMRDGRRRSSSADAATVAAAATATEALGDERLRAFLPPPAAAQIPLAPIAPSPAQLQQQQRQQLHRSSSALSALPRHSRPFSQISNDEHAARARARAVRHPERRGGAPQPPPHTPPKLYGLQQLGGPKQYRVSTPMDLASWEVVEIRGREREWAEGMAERCSRSAKWLMDSRRDQAA